MITVKVSELGFSKCRFVANGRDENEILEKIYSHTRKDHPEYIKDITLEKKREIRERIKKLTSSQK
jgi:predicted small metal-binding protein